MSNETERRSMDDVLASIRRIIRSDKSVSEAANSSETAPGDDPVKRRLARSDTVQTAPAGDAQAAVSTGAREAGTMQPGSKSSATGPGTARPAAANPAAQDAPLSLTPDMMVSAPPLPQQTIAQSAPPPAQQPEATAPAPAVVEQKPAPAPLVLDEAAIEGMVRRVLHEELMGQVGQNISANVQRMIEMEVAKLLPKPK